MWRNRASFAARARERESNMPTRGPDADAMPLNAFSLLRTRKKKDVDTVECRDSRLEIFSNLLFILIRPTLAVNLPQYDLLQVKLNYPQI